MPPEKQAAAEEGEKSDSDDDKGSTVSSASVTSDVLRARLHGEFNAILGKKDLSLIEENCQQP